MTTDRIAKLLQDIRLLDAERHALVQSLRTLIHGLGPGISEEVKYGGFLFSAQRPFCGVFSYAEHLTLEFGQGASLPDPHGELEGQGKFRRHLKLQSTADVDGKRVKHFLALAYAAAAGN